MLQNNSLSKIDNNILTIIKKAGFDRFTPVQKKVIPPALQGKDLAVETVNTRGKTAAFILPLLHLINPDEPGIKALIILNDPAGVKKVERQFRLFTSHTPSCPTIESIGCETGIKTESSCLKKNPDIVIGTNTRIIDHIRRNNLNLAKTEIAVVYKITFTPAREFLKDIEYIFSKFSKKPQSLFFTPKLRGEEISYFFPRKPHIISIPAPKNLQKEHIYFETKNRKDKLQLFLGLIQKNTIKQSIIICGTPQSGGEVASFLNAEGQRCITLLKKNALRGETYPERDFNSGSFDHLITTLEILDTTLIAGSPVLLFFDFVVSAGNFTKFIFSERTSITFPRIILFITNKKAIKFQRLQERSQMNFEKKTPPGKEEAGLGVIEKLVRKVKEEEDPEELDKYRKIIKKNIPFSLRSYTFALLLKEFLVKPSNNSFTTLFVSIGKNRKVFPRDLVKLFTSTLKIEEASIGSIKILDNYSFIDIADTYAEKAIAALDGKEYRHRKITVNFAKKREE